MLLIAIVINDGVIAGSGKPYSFTGIIIQDLGPLLGVSINFSKDESFSSGDLQPFPSVMKDLIHQTLKSLRPQLEIQFLNAKFIAENRCLQISSTTAH